MAVLRALVLVFVFSVLAQQNVVAQVTWVTPGDGDWADGANWSGGNVPTLADDVVVDQGGGFLVTLGDGATNFAFGANTLNSQENLLLTQNADLAIADGGTVNGSFTLGSDSIFAVNGGSFSANGATVLDGGNLEINNANVDFRNVTSYLADSGTNFDRSIVANNSTLNLSGITTLTGNAPNRRFEIESATNASIDLSGLTEVTGGSTLFSTVGIGSTIDLNQLTTFNSTSTLVDGSGFSLTCSTGGNIEAVNLRSFTSSTLTAVIEINSGATLDTQVLETLTNTTVRLESGLNINTVTDFTGSAIDLDNGVTLFLPGVTSYDANGGGNQNRNWSAAGESSIIASGITAADAGTFIRQWNVSATEGSLVDLSGLTDINSGAATFQADGADSLVDISSLTNFNNTNFNRRSLITAVNGGEVRLSGDNTDNLAFSNVDIELRASGTLDTSRIVSLTEGRFDTDTDVTLNLTDGTGSSFFTTANLDASSLVGALVTTGTRNNSSSDFTADGPDALLNLTGVTSLETTTETIIGNTTINALNGGLVDLSNVTTITAPSGLINSSREFVIESQGANSVVDLSSTTSFSDLSSNSQSSVAARDGGQVRLGNTVLTNVDLLVENGGTILGSTVELVSQEFTNSGDPDDFSVLSGDGTIQADIINTSGIVSPGLSPGTLTIDGNFTQGANGTLALEIESLSAFDELNITGDGFFDGIFELTLDDAFDLGANQEFQVVTIDGISNGTFTDLTEGSIVFSDNGFDLRISYFGGDGNDIVLLTSAVPEPGSTGLLLACIVSLTIRRRRPTTA